jgi:hypothetical protein
MVCWPTRLTHRFHLRQAIQVSRKEMRHIGQTCLRHALVRFPGVRSDMRSQQHIGQPPQHIDWRKYSWVVRAKIRRLTLAALGQLESNTGTSQTATAIRKFLRTENAVGLNPVMRAIKDLVKLGLVQQDGVTDERSCKLYRLTRMGRRILDQQQY